MLNLENPIAILDKFARVIKCIEDAPAGGEGLEGKLSVVRSHDKWFYSLMNYNSCPDELKKCLQLIVGIYTKRILPDEYQILLEHDVGLGTLWSIMLGESVFYLCDDCRNPLTTLDKEDGCPRCGDCFNDQTRYKIDLEAL